MASQLLPTMTSVTHGATKELRRQSDFGRHPEIPRKAHFRARHEEMVVHDPVELRREAVS
jgi:hypothetical protein